MVYVVDDDASFLAAVSRLLRATGYTVQTYSKAEAFLAQLADARYVNNRATAFLAFVELGVLALDDIGKLCRIKRRYAPRPAHQV